MNLTFFRLRKPFWNLRLPRLGLLDRYIWQSLWGPFLFAAGLFSSLTIAIGGLFEILNDFANAPIPLPILLELLLLQLPYCIGIALPMAVLLATLLGLGRLSADSELIALRSFGVGLVRLLIPVLGFGFLVSSLTFAFNETLVPNSLYQSTQLQERALREGISNAPVENVFLPQYDDVGNIQRLFFAGRMEGPRMYGLTLLDFSQRQVNQVLTAATAEWNQPTNSWKFTDGTIYFVTPDGSSSDVLQFGQNQLQIARSAQAGPSVKNFPEMTLPEAQQQLQRLRQSGDERQYRRLAIHIQQRFAIPFQGVILSLMGSALAIRNPRAQGGRSQGFGLSVLIVIAQYVLFFLATGFGVNGLLSPVAASWLPSGLGLGFSVWLLLHINR